MTRPLQTETIEQLPQVRQMLAQGMRYWQIAHRLHVPEHRVRYLIDRYINTEKKKQA